MPTRARASRSPRRASGTFRPGAARRPTLPTKAAGPTSCASSASTSTSRAVDRRPRASKRLVRPAREHEVLHPLPVRALHLDLLRDRVEELVVLPAAGRRLRSVEALPDEVLAVG